MKMTGTWATTGSAFKPKHGGRPLRQSAADESATHAFRQMGRTGDFDREGHGCRHSAHGRLVFKTGDDDGGTRFRGWQNLEGDFGQEAERVGAVVDEEDDIAPDGLSHG